MLQLAVQTFLGLNLEARLSVSLWVIGQHTPVLLYHFLVILLGGFHSPLLLQLSLDFVELGDLSIIIAEVLNYLGLSLVVSDTRYDIGGCQVLTLDVSHARTVP